MQEINKEYLVPKLRGLIGEKYTLASTAAKEWGISSAYLSKVINDPETHIPDIILADMGYEREDIKKTVYRKSSSK